MKVIYTSLTRDNLQQKTRLGPEQDDKSAQAGVQNATADAEPTASQVLSIQPANSGQHWKHWDSEYPPPSVTSVQSLVNTQE